MYALYDLYVLYDIYGIYALYRARMPYMPCPILKARQEIATWPSGATGPKELIE